MKNQAFEDLMVTAMSVRRDKKASRRIKMGHVLAILLGFLFALFLFGCSMARAGSAGFPTPNGAGITFRVPLQNFEAVKERAELHLHALAGRSKLMSFEAPLHGRFVRLKVAKAKFVMRFKSPAATKLARSAATNAVSEKSRRPRMPAGKLYRRPQGIPARRGARPQGRATQAFAAVPGAARAASTYTIEPSGAAAADARSRGGRPAAVKRYNRLRAWVVALAARSPEAAKRYQPELIRAYRAAVAR